MKSASPRISLSTGTIIRFFMVVLAILLLYKLFEVVLVIVAAIVIASAIEPVIRRLVHRKVPRILAVIIVYLATAALLGAFLVFFVPTVLSDALSFLNNLPNTISLDNLWSPIRDFGTSVNDASSALASPSISLSDLAAGLQSMISGTSVGVFHTASVFFGGVLSFILIAVLSFYFSVQEDGVDEFLRIIAPVRSQAYISDLWKRSQRKIGFWLQGQILLGVIVGVLVYLILMVVGIPHALTLAVLAAIFEIIPVFGPIISSVPAILVSFADKGIGTTLLLMGLYIIVYQFESQLFYPLVVKKIVGISPIVVILALIIGAELAGVLGALIAVPLSAAFMEYIHDIQKHKKEEQAELATS